MGDSNAADLARSLNAGRESGQAGAVVLMLASFVVTFALLGWSVANGVVGAIPT